MEIKIKLFREYVNYGYINVKEINDDRIEN